MSARVTDFIIIYTSIPLLRVGVWVNVVTFVFTQDEEYILNVPVGMISHIEKVDWSQSRREHVYGLKIYCKVGTATPDT